MKKTVAAAGLVLAVLLATGWSRETGVAQVANVASGDALQAKAEAMKDALLKNDPDAAFKALAPWMQGRAELMKAVGAANSSKVDDDEHRSRLWEHITKECLTDADGTPCANAGINSLEDLVACSAGKQLWVFSGCYKLTAAEERAEQLKGPWFLVDRRVLLEQIQVRGSDPRKPSWATRSVGIVAWMLADFRSRIEVRCVAEGNEWMVVGFSVRLGRENVDTGKVLDAPTYEGGLEIGVRNAMRSEAEGQLGSMKGQARVGYAKTGTAPKTLTASFDKSGAGVNSEELKGKYFTVRDKVYSSSKGEGVLAAVCTEKGEGAGYGLHVFKWAGGSGRFEWFDTEAELDAAIAKLAK